MARRRPRSLGDELAQHATIARSVQQLCASLAVLEPDVDEFKYAQKVIADGVKVLEQKHQALAQQPAPKAEAPK